MSYCIFLKIKNITHTFQKVGVDVALYILLHIVYTGVLKLCVHRATIGSWDQNMSIKLDLSIYQNVD